MMVSVMQVGRKRRFDPILFLTVLSLLWAVPVQAGERVAAHNTVNTPFRTITREPLSAFRVQADRLGQTGEPTRQAIRLLSDQYSRGQVQGLFNFLRSHRPNLWEPRFGELLIVEGSAAGSRLATAARAGQGEITFEYVGYEGFQVEETQVRAFVEAFYPVAKETYGPPGFTITVKIVRDPEVHGLLGGTYVVSTHEIHTPPLSDNHPYDFFNLGQMILHSFHDAAFLAYDSWEKGFVRAAATLCVMRMAISFEPMQDPNYLLPIYDLLNQPALGNPTFFPSEDYTAMFPFRVALSEAAWLKVAVEHPAFFRDFNAAYYAQWNPNSPTELSGNIPALREIASAAALRVEDKPFGEWYEGQWALDTSVSLGTKFFIYHFPAGRRIRLWAVYYTTGSAGSETPRGGTVELEYFDYTHTHSLFAQEGYSIPIPFTGPDAGQGFLSPQFFNINGSQRVFVELVIGDIARTLYFPYSDTEEPDLNGFFGAVTGDNQGALSIELNGSQIAQSSAQQGAYFASAATITEPGVVTLRYDNSYGQEVIERRNVAYAYYVLQVRNAAQRQLFSHRFSRGGNGVHLISLPFIPADPSPSQALGIAANRLLLAEWQPAHEGNRYRLYPQIPQMVPGKGYMLKIFQDLDLSTLGTPVPADVSYRVELQPGWNLIGNPFPSSVSLANLEFQRPNDGPYAFATAANMGWISPDVFGFTQATGYQAASTLEPWLGYWIFVTIEEGVVAFIPPP